MKLLYTLDDKNYPLNGTIYYRKAVRGIIFKGNKLAMIKTINKEYKFPGGGQEAGETDFDTLLREVIEETGLEVIRNSIVEYGIIKEIRKSIIKNEQTFIMDSYYYMCSVHDKKHKLKLDDYELEDGYELVFITVKEAYESNMQLIDDCYWIRRDTLILKELMEK